MDDQQLLGILGQGGLGAGLLFLLWKIGTRIVAALDALVKKVDEHTKVDLEYHAHVRAELAELSGRLEGLAFANERTPVEVPAPRRPAAGTVYQIPRRRGETNNGGNDE